jgi:hypothetical protein
MDERIYELQRLFRKIDFIKFKRELRFYGIVPMNANGVTLDILNKELERLRGKLNELQSTTL